MFCKNHSDQEAKARCTGCQEPFCGNCLIEISGHWYCGSCKVMAVQGKPVVGVGTIPCKEANEALIFAIVGLFCFGIILEPVAIYKANKAKKLIEEDPRLAGSGKITATYIIAAIGLLFWIVGLLAKFGGR